VHVGVLRGGIHQEALVGSGVRCHPLPHLGHHDPRLLSGIFGLIRTHRPDVVQTWLTQMDILGGLASRASSVPWVLTERSSADCYPPTVKNWARARGAAGASAIVANSAGGRDYWRTVARVRAPISIVPNAVPLDEIDRAAPVRSSELPTLLFAGRFGEEKNIPLLIDAFRGVRAHLDAELVLCGDGPARREVEHRVREHGLGGRVHVLGFRDDVIGRMKCASVFVSLSRFEGCPNAVLEAMAAGCPLVLSDIAAHREIVDDRTGRLVEAGDADAVAAALLAALRDRAGAAARARAARQAVEAWSPSAAAALFVELYRQVTAASPPRRRRTAS
jgi:glycosyltransferase involved in cell wall biosynthesis